MCQAHQGRDCVPPDFAKIRCQKVGKSEMGKILVLGLSLWRPMRGTGDVAAERGGVAAHSAHGGVAARGGAERDAHCAAARGVRGGVVARGVAARGTKRRGT